MINNNRLYYANRKGKRGGYGFNCWGATLFTIGAIDKLEWLECDEITEFIENETISISESALQRGDILVLIDRWDEIMHTAIYLGRGKYFHKSGSNHSEITDLRSILHVYYEYEDIYFKRIRRGE
jgi:NlpC/P60 family